MAAVVTGNEKWEAKVRGKDWDEGSGEGTGDDGSGQGLGIEGQRQGLGI